MQKQLVRDRIEDIEDSEERARRYARQLGSFDQEEFMKDFYNKKEVKSQKRRYVNSNNQGKWERSEGV